MRVSVILLSLSTVAACAPRAAVLADLVDARRLAADLHVAFTKAVEASNRAVMADTDETSMTGANQARQLRRHARADLEALRPVLERLRYSADAQLLEAFAQRFDAYGKLDDDILPLAVENTNLKAQRLSFTDARHAAAAFRSVLASDASAASSRAQIGVLEILADQAPHIAEADDAVMTRIEAEMRASEQRVRAALRDVDRSRQTKAIAAFDTFMAVNAQIVTLSRRNSNVRSLALAMGQKQIATAQCEAALQALDQALATHEFRATR